MKTNTKQIFIFLHIAKAGGTTLGKILGKNFLPAQQMTTHIGKSRSALGVWPYQAFNQAWGKLESNRKQEIAYIAGHSLFGIHRAIERPCTYVSMVRNPIERVVSSYYYIATQPGIPVYRDIADGLSLVDYITSKKGLDPHNYQTRILSGLETLDVPWDRVRESLNENIQMAVLEMAKKNILDHFSVLGPVEEFDRALMLMKLKHGWPIRQLIYRKENVNLSKPSLDSLDPATISAIKEANKLDIQLYNFACEHFKIQCQPFKSLLDDLVPLFSEACTLFQQSELIDQKLIGSELADKCANIDKRFRFEVK